MDTNQVKPEFGYGCFPVYGIVHSIASVKNVFRMTENYSSGLQIMLLGS